MQSVEKDITKHKIELIRLTVLFISDCTLTPKIQAPPVIFLKGFIYATEISDEG